MDNKLNTNLLVSTFRWKTRDLNNPNIIKETTPIYNEIKLDKGVYKLSKDCKLYDIAAKEYLQINKDGNYEITDLKWIRIEFEGNIKIIKMD